MLVFDEGVDICVFWVQEVVEIYVCEVFIFLVMQVIICLVYVCWVQYGFDQKIFIVCFVDVFDDCGENCIVGIGVFQ